MALVLKKDQESGAPVVTEEGKIIYIDDKDNSEIPLDPVAMYDKIGVLGQENQKHRTRYQTAESSLKIFEGIEDLEDWKSKADKALETVENFNDKDWMKADKVEKLKKDITEGFQQKLDGQEAVLKETITQHKQEIGVKETQIRKLMVSNQFAISPHFVGKNKKTTLPPKVGEAYFGDNYKVEEENGEPVLRAYDNRGELIRSKINPGEPADFEESLSILIDASPDKDEILAASKPGGGGKGGHGDGEGQDDLATLKEKHKEATQNGNVQLAISLKNKIFEMERAS